MPRRAIPLLLALLSSVALAGKKPPPTEAPTPAAARVELPPPSAEVLRAVNPHAALAPTPNLHASTDTLNIQTMQRAVLIYELQLPDLGLAGFDAPRVAAARQTLAADPRWRLSGAPGQLSATPRLAAGAAWRAGPDGWQDDGRSAWRAAIRFGALRPDDPWATSPLVVRATPSTTKVRLQAAALQDAPWTGRKATAFVVEGSGVSVDVFEAGLGDERVATQSALANIAEILQVCDATWDMVRDDGVAGMLLPEGEPGAPGLKILTPAPRQMELQARANPGEEGWTWLRLVAGGRAWEEAAVAAGTREVIGASPRPEQGFWMQSTFAVPSGAPFQATAELWFLPLSGAGTPRRIATYEVTVPGR